MVDVESSTDSGNHGSNQNNNGGDGNNGIHNMA